jgi:hypothetical protein
MIKKYTSFIVSAVFSISLFSASAGATSAVPAATAVTAETVSTTVNTSPTLANGLPNGRVVQKTDVYLKLDNPANYNGILHIYFDDQAVDEPQNQMSVFYLDSTKWSNYTGKLFPNRTYKPIFDFGDNNGKYDVVFSAGAPINIIRTADITAPITLEWKIVQKSTATTTSPTVAVAANSVPQSNSGGNTAVSNANANTSKLHGDPNNNISNVSGTQMLERFQSKTAFIKDNPKYENDRSMIWWYYDQITTEWSKNSGKTSDEFKAMPKYDRFCWNAVCGYPKHNIVDLMNNSMSEQLYPKTWDTYIYQTQFDTLVDTVAKVDESKRDEYKAALTEVFEWYWNNWQLKHMAYSPYGTLTSENPVSVTSQQTMSPAEVSEAQSQLGLNESDIAQINNATATTANATNQPTGAEETGGILGFFSKHWVDFAILGGAVAIFLIYKAVKHFKEKNDY